ncbi:hypothetical protein QQS21_011014 [Conoideocrella luteorostrata]|uniref:Uncharacterized protein n=1 Tax=Conoideocrella luteorostrata TaxID=1105319 RepID=A0AAJ0FNT2_9HYPO|nr:hypothetical protein QQS21_011014 [Conoideocrella luteorostrata]
MKHQWLSAVLWATSLLLVVEVTGRPDATLDYRWDRRGAGSSTIKEVPEPPEDPPAVVFRGDTRDPELVFRDQGFLTRNTGKLAPEEEEIASSLYYHTYGLRPDITKYVSATTKPKVAYQFSSDLLSNEKKFGYLWRISADEKFVDAVKTLGNNIRSGYAAQAEQAAAGDIGIDQIEGYYASKDLTDKDLEMLEKGYKLEHKFHPNDKLDKKRYGPLRGGGAQEKLRGYRIGSDAYKEYPERAAKNLKEYQESICKGSCFRTGREDTGTEIAEEEEFFTSADYIGVRDLTGALDAGEVPEGLASLKVIEAGQAAEEIEVAAELEAEATEAFEAMEAGEVAAVGAEGLAVIEEILMLLGLV